MSKFKVGDFVVVLGCASGKLEKFIGKTGKIDYVYSDGVSYNIQFPDELYHVYAKDGELMLGEDMSKFHKHHDLIIAWAKGAEIQTYDGTHQKWLTLQYAPDWRDDRRYRIKPEPKPDIVMFGAHSPNQVLLVRDNGLNTAGICLTKLRSHVDSIKYTFDGETGKLKAVELIQ